MTDPRHFTAFSQWLTWLEHRNPGRIELGLQRVERVWRLLQSCHHIVPPVVITVAGTNGKGSSCALLDAILQAAGYRVGRYTSPHLSAFNERILIQGQPADEQVLADGMAALYAIDESEHLTYFEWATLLAFFVFARNGCGVWLLEVGMGGRLDAVNILSADLALITNIGLDHQAFLGPTRESIGVEKAGILRENQIAVYADPDPVTSVIAAADRIGCRLLLRSRDFWLQITPVGWQLHGLGENQTWSRPALFGLQQIDNAAGVLALLQSGQTVVPVSTESIENGLRSVGLPGRFERKICAQRQLIFDVAHNKESTDALLANLRDWKMQQKFSGQCRAIFSALADKPIQTMLQQCVGQFDAWYLAPLEDPRAASLAQLQQAAAVLRESDIHYEPNIVSAYNRAFIESNAGDWLVVFGSFHTVGALRVLPCDDR